jgi:hypothetical protein
MNDRRRLPGHTPGMSPDSKITLGLIAVLVVLLAVLVIGWWFPIVYLAYGVVLGVGLATVGWWYPLWVDWRNRNWPYGGM